ncbi:DUF1801 domain-containing protein [Amycolatopsis sp. OK19-0408]|uniref:DUF1801 domain-containing protein n=1 Tax=Amycolatopsis iheyensis TaxID=2945988 RepID=A0A9X2NFE7_9PSEU|nr:DUF1801 domain-containing protein [Amycolatopsis iheyensis]MCR6485885.1 DUF1801 domain-containing protein [Amycolatopsis iheyensis]
MTHEEYFAALAEPRQGELRALHALIREAAPDLAPTMVSGLPGYGHYRYRYASGREGEAATVSLASRKNGISLYVSCVAGDRYLPELFADRLPGASVGRSCVRFKRLSDVDIGVLRELLRAAAETPPAGVV